MSQPKVPSIFHRPSAERQCKDNVIKVKIYGETVHLCEFITGRLFFCTIKSGRVPKDCPEAHYFSIDEELVYLNYVSDFGPLNLGHLAKYFNKLKSKLKLTPSGKMIIHYTTSNERKRVNAAFLMGSFAIMYLGKTPKDAYQMLLVDNDVKWEPYKPFQDASKTNSSYQLRLLECLEGLNKAHKCGFIRFNDFNAIEYDYYSSIKHGDINWMVPRKIIAFSGPVAAGQNVPYRPPEFYVKYFLDHNVRTVVRLNKKAYDYQCFTRAGIDHHELYFTDGTTPPPAILKQFLKLSESTEGVIAIHCKAGLGRTGSLIGAYLIKHYRMRAKEAIAWMRIARPGCVIGKQQTWLEDCEEDLTNEGNAYRLERYGNEDYTLPHPYGINSIVEKHHQQLHGELQKGIPPSAPDREMGLIPALEAIISRNNPSPSSCGNNLGAGSSGKKPGVTGTIRTLSGVQKGRKQAYVPGKIISEMAKTPEDKRMMEREKEQETQGDKLRKRRAIKEKWYGPSDDRPNEKVD